MKNTLIATLFTLLFSTCAFAAFDLTFKSGGSLQCVYKVAIDLSSYLKSPDGEVLLSPDGLYLTAGN